MRKNVGPAVSAIAFIVLTGCVGNHQYRVPNALSIAKSSFYGPDQPHPYYLAFIEFDEFGELWDRRQLQAALEIIKRAESPVGDAQEVQARSCDGRTTELGGPIRLVIFIHGWKNNAAPGNGNVYGFEDELRAIHQLSCARRENKPVVGVYVGWRGATIKAPVVKELTYWNRHDTAQRIAGTHLTATLDELILTAKAKYSDSVAVVIGHSFGGQILERAISQSTLQQLEDAKVGGLGNDGARCSRLSQFGRDYCAVHAPANNGPGFVPGADLIVLLNEAAPATESIQMLTFLKLTGYHLCRQVPPKPGQQAQQSEERPLIVSMTSEGDTATGFALNIGQGASLLKDSLTTRKLRHYPSSRVLPACMPPDIEKQSYFYDHSTANVDSLVSHYLQVCTPDQRQALLGPSPPGHLIATCAENRFDSENRFDPRLWANAGGDIRSCVPEKLYCMVRRDRVWNDTAYWVMKIPREIVKDHTDIFNPELQAIIASLITQPRSPSEMYVSTQ